MKRFERFNGLDTALYKNYLYLFLLPNLYTLYAGPSKRHSLDPEGHSLDPLEPSKGRPFTAPDGGTTGCANMSESGWWFPSSCNRTLINLNGRHNSTGRIKYSWVL